jgi:hypothetical protein
VTGIVCLVVNELGLEAPTHGAPSGTRGLGDAVPTRAISSDQR